MESGKTTESDADVILWHSEPAPAAAVSYLHEPNDGNPSVASAGGNPLVASAEAQVAEDMSGKQQASCDTRRIESSGASLSDSGSERSSDNVTKPTESTSRPGNRVRTEGRTAAQRSKSRGKRPMREELWKDSDSQNQADKKTGAWMDFSDFNQVLDSFKLQDHLGNIAPVVKELAKGNVDRGRARDREPKKDNDGAQRASSLKRSKSAKGRSLSTVCVCVRERERESVCVCECLCLCA